MPSLTALATALAATVVHTSLVYNFSQRPPVEVASGAIRVRTETGVSAPPWGYTPIRVTVESTSPRPQEVKLSFVGQGVGASVVRKRIEVAPGSLQVASLLVPASNTYGRIEAEAEGIDDLNRPSVYLSRGTFVILAVGSEKDFEAAIGHGPDPSSYSTWVRTLVPGELPEELHAYVGFGEVVVTGAFEELSEPSRRVLEEYAATGGTLVLLHPPRAPEQLLPLLGSAASWSGETSYGFGKVVLCDGPFEEAIAHHTPASTAVVVPREGSNLQRFVTRSLEGGRFLLPQATAPIGRFLGIILIFTLAIGPGSLWVARRRGPAYLLVTIPSTAAVTCLLIVGFSLLVDGLSAHASVRGFTLLDSPRHRAVMVGVGGFYANLAINHARFDDASVPVTAEGAGGLQVDFTQGATYSGAVIPSRSYRELGFLSVQPSRARLMVRKDAEGLVLENALGATARNVAVKVDGRTFVAHDLRDGGSVRLNSPGKFDALRIGSTGARDRFAPAVIAKFTAPLEEGAFVAELDGPGELPLGGMRLDHHDSTDWVRGEVSR